MNKAAALILILAITAVIIGCAQKPATEKPAAGAPQTLTEENQQTMSDAEALDELEDAELDKEMDDLSNVLNQI